MSRAAVLTGAGRPFEIWDVEVDGPKVGEVAVRLGATGLCHSDLHASQGSVAESRLPMILGHEGAGVIEAVGDGVTGMKVGDHVVMSFRPMCGECWFCVTGQSYLCMSGIQAMMAGTLLDGTSRVHRAGQDISQMACLGTFAERAVVPVSSVVKVPDRLPLKLVALLGCGVMTGFGAAVNTADINSGDSVVVLGCGGVGLNTIQGARLAGAGEIIAVDVVPLKLEMAQAFGATRVVEATEADPVAAVLALTEGRGVDHAFEVIGTPRTTVQAIDMTRPGGETILVGIGKEPVSMNMGAFILSNKTLKGSVYGSSNFRTEIAKLIEFYESGQLKLEELVSRELKLDQVNDGFTAMTRGEVARSVIIF